MTADAHPAAPEFSVAGNQLQLLREPSHRLAALLGLIADARISLRLLYYIFEDDQTGVQIRDALAAAAQRGVQVDLIIDSFGSAGTDAQFFSPLVAAGGKFSQFSPHWTKAYLVRNHQKFVIADNDAALIGGFNIADSYFGESNSGDGWEDLGLIISGPAVPWLTRYFDRLSQWTHDDNRQVRKFLQRIEKNSPAGQPLQWLLGSPGTRMSHWARAIKQDLERSQHLDMVTAYFSPGLGFLRRIGQLAKRGTVRLVLAGRTDNGATIGAARLLYGFLLKRGAQVQEYQPHRLHTKLIVLDDIVYIGSANFDARSLFINFELMLRIEDSTFAAHARDIVDALSSEAENFDLVDYRAKAGWFNRLRWLLAYFLVNIIDYSVTRRLNFGLRPD
ncbi:MAG: phosphatidylserine/phosphatidylglycerophosphate/cardiolipin synthase family protein [Parasphingorhabdus sp.]|nr:phosphatidylserine/phosphatidylglycerophosphate/cardiolipin synthase family protein [Parasphingorhabdus sp.]